VLSGYITECILCSAWYITGPVHLLYAWSVVMGICVILSALPEIRKPIYIIIIL